MDKLKQTWLITTMYLLKTSPEYSQAAIYGECVFIINYKIK